MDKKGISNFTKLAKSLKKDRFTILDIEFENRGSINHEWLIKENVSKQEVIESIKNWY
jgi:hypothetical protein